MAKKSDIKKPSGGRPSQRAVGFEAGVVAFAEQLGEIVGTVQTKADGWLDREALTEQLASIRDGAAHLLDQIGTAAKSVSGSGGGKKPAGNATKGRATTPAGPGTIAGGRSGGMVDAPGKKHRKPPPSQRGVKHSEVMIAKANAAQQMRRRPRG